ncbi:glycosyltransferase [Parahaliea sp. F7430]|uniref:Glycosyltransferase n=1 Tax=Sediminihaliea albiluteola TaxID=2758564 RepID=A0A7W2TUQ7_9GAMM|nr:glycosyltransferase [Sediminihaliea albiluteola]MBA6412298.1 glycosyltransferase [Sediminihaliea albiluteola]
MLGTNKPLITFALFAYNQERFVREAVEGALGQDYDSLEIILSDDCSGDRTFEVMTEMVESYAGPHRIILNKNDRNLGIGGHIKKVSSLSNGDIIVMAAGDDISSSQRVSSLAQCYDINTYAVFSEGYRFCRNKKIIHRSWIKNVSITLSDIVKGGGGVGTGATYSYRKECFSQPWLYPTEFINEDRLLPLRAILLGSIKYLAKPLVFCRVHENNVSRKSDFVLAVDNPKHMLEVLRTLNFYLESGCAVKEKKRNIGRAKNLVMFDIKTFRHKKTFTIRVAYSIGLFVYIICSNMIRKCFICLFGKQ